ncbi:uncharacterized protein CANTADRAFT_27143, partial [Suhomyces tanzawaensis NRRL Y-17324]
MTSSSDQQDILQSLDDEYREDLAIHLYSSVLLNRIDPAFPRLTWGGWPLPIDDVPIPRTSLKYADNMVGNDEYEHDIDVDFAKLRADYRKVEDALHRRKYGVSLEESRLKRKWKKASSLQPTKRQKTLAENEAEASREQVDQVSSNNENDRGEKRVDTAQEVDQNSSNEEDSDVEAADNAQHQTISSDEENSGDEDQDEQDEQIDDPPNTDGLILNENPPEETDPLDENYKGKLSFVYNNDTAKRINNIKYIQHPSNSKSDLVNEIAHLIEKNITQKFRKAQQENSTADDVVLSPDLSSKAVI